MHTWKQSKNNYNYDNVADLVPNFTPNISNTDHIWNVE